MVNSIAFSAYPVVDMARARRFYEEILGLKLDTNFRDEWIEYDVGGATLAITTMMGKDRSGSTGACVGLEVDDLDAAVARLKSVGVPFKFDVFATSVCRMCVVLDPDGNGIVIHKRHPAKT